MWEYNRVTQNATGWAKKSKPDNFCNNFVYCQPIFIIFGTYTLQEICNPRIYSQPTSYCKNYQAYFFGPPCIYTTIQQLSKFDRRNMLLTEKCCGGKLRERLSNESYLTANCNKNIEFCFTFVVITIKHRDVEDRSVNPGLECPRNYKSIVKLLQVIMTATRVARRGC